MLSIFATTEFIDSINHIIHSENRLHELVAVYDRKQQNPQTDGYSLIVDQNGISLPIDWSNSAPPLLIQQPIKLEPATLLGLIFHKLGNTEKAWHLTAEYPELQTDLNLKALLQYGYQIPWHIVEAKLNTKRELTAFDHYRNFHNAAVISQYGEFQESIDADQIETYYNNALQQATTPEYTAYTSKELAIFFLDSGRITEAESLIHSTLQTHLPPEATFALKAILSKVWMKKLTIPYDQVLLEALKQTLWETLTYFENQGQKAEAGIILLDAAHVANISESYAESLGYITKAIRFFEEEELMELAGNAQLSKGTLLHTWAQNGNPQFLKPAIESYQEALKIFTKEATPEVFAEIHHHLGMLYTETLNTTNKKAMLASVAVSSFDEALSFYTKEAYPYEYGTICNNYGNAYTKFPQAVLTDNFEKALFYYQEALDVRSSNVPYERALTLLNFLEASWKVGNDPASFNEARYEDMLHKAQEVISLVSDPNLLGEANKHLELLKELKAAIV